jgi:hypothetical protein
VTSLPPHRRPACPIGLRGAGAHLAPAHAGGRIGFEDFLREHVSPGARSAPYGRLR